MGQPQQALAPAQEAVTIRRRLAEANPDAHLPNLATSLTNLKESLAAAGRNEDVAKVEEELASVLLQMSDGENDSPP